MHKIETILGGITIIIFGIASLLIFEHTKWSLFEILGISCPIIGLIFSVTGLFYEPKSE